MYNRVDRLRSHHDVVFVAPIRRPSDIESVKLLPGEPAGKSKQFPAARLGEAQGRYVQNPLRCICLFRMQWVTEWDDTIGQDSPTRQIPRILRP